MKDNPIRMGSTINCGGRRNLECGKLTRCQTQGWHGVGYCFAMDEAYRIWSSQWYPIGSIVVTQSAMDVDLCIDTERTMDTYISAWLARGARAEGPEIQLELGLWKETLIAMTGFLFGVLSVLIGQLIAELYFLFSEPMTPHSYIKNLFTSLKMFASC